ncbi:MAG: YjjG family noncanonical pyrimidine nucleotidase [Lachnospiraceae bacterium]|nr:YjjG family noncanonical pyrimidine nucleotidase [Lachnospiraceae bacterium]
MKHTYKILLMDLDDTILDFKKTEREALRKAFGGYGLELDEAQIHAYSAINLRCWKRLERKEINKEELKTLRFSEFLGTLPKAPPVSVEQVNRDYMEALGSFVFPLPGAEEAVRTLAQSYRLAVITNGTTWVQERRFAGLSVRGCFERMFISDELGVQKPDPRFFEQVREAMGEADASRYLVIGDSLTSDILGGIWAGMDTCLVSPEPVPDCPANYWAPSLSEVLKILL